MGNRPLQRARETDGIDGIVLQVLALLAQVLRLGRAKPIACGQDCFDPDLLFGGVMTIRPRKTNQQCGHG